VIYRRRFKNHRNKTGELKLVRASVGEELDWDSFCVNNVRLKPGVVDDERGENEKAQLTRE